MDCLAYALRDTPEKGFDCGFLTFRQHLHNDRLCLYTSCDDCDKITGTFFQRCFVETNHISSGHVFPIDIALNITINDTHDRFITDNFFDTVILNSTINQAQQYLFFISLGKGTPGSIPRECLGSRRVAMTMRALIACRTKTNTSFPAQNGQMSSRDLTIFTIKLGGHLATSMTRGPFHRAFHGDLHMTEAIRRHVLDGYLGDVEGALKSLAHRWTRFPGYWNVNLLT